MSIRPSYIVTILITLLMVGGKVTQAQVTVPTSPQTASPVKHPLADLPAMQLKMDYDPILTKYPIIYIKVNDSEPKPFIFDTGYSGAILMNEDEVKKLGLEIIDSDTINSDVNGVRNAVRKSIVKSLEMLKTDGSYAPNTDITVNIGRIPTNDEASFPTPTIGIVGLRLFRKATLVFDFDRHELRIIKAEHADISDREGFLSAPLVYEEGILKVDVSDLMQKKELLILDTGAENTRLSNALIQKFKPSLSFDTSSQGGSGAVRKDKSYLIDSIRLKETPINNLIITEARGNESILGIDVLGRFRLTVDTSHQRMILEQSGTFAEQNKFAPGYCGLDVQRRSEGYIVISRATNEYKDLVGCQLVAIDDKRIQGKAIKDLPLAQIQSVLDGYAHTEANITVRSRGIDRTMAIKRRSLSEILPLLKEMK